LPILCADIGGTNARVAIVEDLQVKLIRVYPTADVPGLPTLLERFAKDTGIKLPKYFALAAAGVMTDGRIKGTNIPWDIDCREIQQELSPQQCIVLNDFEAAAWGLLAIGEEMLVKIGGAEPIAFGTKAILGAGTGLGEAIVVHCQQTWQVLRTEGGHTSYSPRDETGLALLAHLMKTYGHVSFERLLSGSGLVEIYRFLAQDHPERLERLASYSLRQQPAHITTLAQDGDVVACRAVDFFLETYGEEASNLALKCLPLGGVYLTGGVTLHLLDFLLKSRFRACFEDKGRMKELLMEIPVFLVKEPLLGIIGAAYRLGNMNLPLKNK